MPVRSSTRMSVAFLDSAARTATSHAGDSVGDSDELLSCRSVCFRSTFVRTRSLTVSYYNISYPLMRFLLLVTIGTVLLRAAPQAPSTEPPVTEPPVTEPRPSRHPTSARAGRSRSHPARATRAG